MYSITIRFYEQLNDFLEPDRRKRDIDFSFPGRRSIKDLIESFGVPHVEVDLILVNGDSVDFNYIVRDGDRISVYPVFETLSVHGVTRLRPVPLRDPKFVLDVHLRKLARRLRLLGFDVEFDGHRDDDELAEISEREDRILLSRDRQLMMRRIVSRGLYVRNTDPTRQVIEILERLDLWNWIRPFSRCIECNGCIETLSGKKMEALLHLVPEGVREWCNEYYHCPSCGRVFWKGSHYDKLRKRVEHIVSKR
jgi:uncharacterized protein with PIN domain/sulfur carrier protein ThiS